MKTTLFVIVALLSAIPVLLKADPFFANIKKLAHVKETLKAKQHIYTAQYEALLETADKILTKKPLSVMLKKQRPPSGDKHDYMSIAPYWWENPNTSTGLPYIRKDGERNPETKDFPDNGNFSTTCSNIFTLSLAYYLSDDVKYAEKAVELVKVWFLNKETKMNPNFNFSQAIKGKNDGRGAGIVSSRHLIYAIDGIEILASSGSYLKEERSEMKQWFSDYLNWLLTSNNGLDEAKAKNNHGSWYDVQVTHLALATGQLAIAKKYAGNFTARVDSQITVDGKQPHELERTKSFGYSCFNAQALVVLARLGNNLELDGWKYKSADGKSLQKAIDYLLPFALNKKEWEYKQIAEREKSVQVKVFILSYLAIKNHEYFGAAKEINGGNLDDVFELLYL